MLLAFQPFHYLVGLFGHLLVDVLTLLVVFVDACGHGQCFLQVALYEQFHGFPSVHHASRGVDARSYLEDDVAHGQFASCQSADVDDGFQTDGRRLVQLLESVEGQYAVFALYGHEVGGYRDGAEVEQRYEPCEGYAVVFGEGLHELESHAASAEVLEGVGRVAPLGVEYGHCGRQFFVRLVVVADDEVDAPLLGVCYLVDGLDAAVEHDDEFHTCLCCVVYALSAYSVSLALAVGYVVVDVGIELLQKLVHQCDGCAAVDVVVAVDHDALLASHGVVQPVDGYVHVVHQEWIDKLVEHGSEESLGRAFRLDASLYEQFGHDGAHADFLGQFLSRL